MQVTSEEEEVAHNDTGIDIEPKTQTAIIQQSRPSDIQLLLQHMQQFTSKQEETFGNMQSRLEN